MKSLKTLGLVLLAAVCVGAAGFSFYRSVIYKPQANLTAEQREKAMGMFAGMDQMRGKSMPAPKAPDKKPKP
jgi:hypothetical protein